MKTWCIDFQRTIVQEVCAYKNFETREEAEAWAKKLGEDKSGMRHDISISSYPVEVLSVELQSIKEMKGA